METIEITRLLPEQWQQYRQIRLEALKNEPQAFSSTYAEMLQRPDAFWQNRLEEAAAGQKSWLLFALDHKRPVGIIGAFYEGDDAAEIISVYVTPDKRGMGISKALMAAIIETVKQVPMIRRVTLTVSADQAPALALYRALQFQVIAEQEALLGDGKNHIEYTMEKHL